uniref:zinc ribbon domain-containing protein n=1 Tax=Okeania sp. SIO2F4 TaxID=2607790 RepID=UPI0035C89EAA
MVKKRCDPATTTDRLRNADQERERAPRDRKLSRAISDLGWRQFRTLLEGKAEKYGRDFRVISRWEATSQTCSICGFKGSQLDLKVREWECLNCGAKHDRDENAAINILVAPWACLLRRSCAFHVAKRNGDIKQTRRQA